MSQLKILLVEDNPVIIGIMQQIFKFMGEKVDVAKNVKEAVNALKKKNYQLMISDIGLPDASGIDLVQQVRALEKSKGDKAAYICGATAFDIEQYQQPCFEAGFDELAAKPMNIHFLKHLLLKAKIKLLKN